jgi:hypothetical protein
MKRSAVIRLSLAIVLPIAIATACSDKQPTGLSSGDNSSIGTGGNSGSGTSGSGTNPQGSPTAADTFSLIVHVTIPTTIGDTLHGTPVAGATTTISRTEWTFIKGNGGDTMSGHTVIAGRATTDANGDAHFDQLPADVYHIIAKGPDGSGLDSGFSNIVLVNVAKGFVPIMLKPSR